MYTTLKRKVSKRNSADFENVDWTPYICNFVPSFSKFSKMGQNKIIFDRAQKLAWTNNVTPCCAVLAYAVLLSRADNYYTAVNTVK